MHLAILNFVSALFAFLAAGFWFASTVTKVRYKPSNSSGFGNGATIQTGPSSGILTDAEKTAEARNMHNRWGAAAACVTALLQGISILLTPAGDRKPQPPICLLEFAATWADLECAKPDKSPLLFPNSPLGLRKQG